MTQSEFDAYIDQKARKVIAEMLSDTEQNTKESNKIDAPKEDMKTWGAKNSKGNSDVNANWTKGKPSGKKDVKINGETSETDRKPEGGVQKAEPKSDENLRMHGHKGTKPSFSA